VPTGKRRRFPRPEVGLEIWDLERRRQLVDVNVHPLEAPHQALRLAGVLGVVGPKEVVTDPRVWHLLEQLVVAFVHGIGLEHAVDALVVRVDPGVVPLGHDVVLVERGLREAGPDRRVVLVDPLLDRVAVVLLERHPGGVEALGRHRVAVEDAEEVVGPEVEVRDLLAVELGRHRRPVEVVDPVDRLVGDLVVHGVGVRRKEVRVRAHLVRVDRQLGWVLAHELDDPVDLGLRRREPVAVHVEPVDVASLVELSSVRVEDRNDQDDRLVQDLLGRAVGPRGEVVEHLEGGVRAALLAAVRAPVHP